MAQMTAFTAGTPSSSSGCRGAASSSLPYDSLVPLVLPCRCQSSDCSSPATRNHSNDKNAPAGNELCFFKVITPADILQSQSSHQSVCVFCSNDYEAVIASGTLFNRQNNVSEHLHSHDKTRLRSSSITLSLFSPSNSLFFPPRQQQQALGDQNEPVISAYGTTEGHRTTTTTTTGVSVENAPQQIASTQARRPNSNIVKQHVFQTELNQLVPSIKRTYIWLSQQCARRQRYEQTKPEAEATLANSTALSPSKAEHHSFSKQSTGNTQSPIRHRAFQAAKRSQSFLILPESTNSMGSNKTTRNAGDIKSDTKSAENYSTENERLLNQNQAKSNDFDSAVVALRQGDVPQQTAVRPREPELDFFMSNNTYRVHHHHCKTIRRKQKKLYHIGVRHLQKQLASCSASNGSAHFGRIPSPHRVALVIGAVKRGLHDTMRIVETDIDALEKVHSERENPYTINVPVEQRIKAASHYLKRLEYHLAKLERTEEAYLMHERLSRGMLNMTNAYVAAVNGNRNSCRRRRRRRERCDATTDAKNGDAPTTVTKSFKSSAQALASVRASYRDCVRVMCLLEAQLEQMLGSFEICMKGIAGFARVCSGDEYELNIYHGHEQRWKTRGRIHSVDGKQQQHWRNDTAMFKMLLSEPVYVAAYEIQRRRTFFGWSRSLHGDGISAASSTPIGNKLCDVLELFCPHPQLITIPLNATGSLKVNVVVTWNPLGCCFWGDSSPDSMENFAGFSHQAITTLFGSSSSLLNRSVWYANGSKELYGIGADLLKLNKHKRKNLTGLPHSSRAAFHCSEPLYLLRMRWHDPISWTFLREQQAAPSRMCRPSKPRTLTAQPVCASISRKEERIYCDIDSLHERSSLDCKKKPKPPLPPTKPMALTKVKPKQRRSPNRSDSEPAEACRVSDLVRKTCSKIYDFIAKLSCDIEDSCTTQELKNRHRQILQNLRHQIQLTFCDEHASRGKQKSTATVSDNDEHELIESALDTFGFLELMDDNDDATTTTTTNSSASLASGHSEQTKILSVTTADGSTSTASTVTYCSTDGKLPRMQPSSSRHTTTERAGSSSPPSSSNDFDALAFVHLQLAFTLLNSLDFVCSYREKGFQQSDITDPRMTTMAATTALAQEARIFDELAEQTAFLNIARSLALSSTASTTSIAATSDSDDGAATVQHCLQLMTDTKLWPTSTELQNSLARFLTATLLKQTESERNSSVHRNSPLLLVPISKFLSTTQTTPYDDDDNVDAVDAVESVILRAIMYDETNEQQKRHMSQESCLSVLQFLSFYWRIKSKVCFVQDENDETIPKNASETDDVEEHVRALMSDFELEARLLSKLQLNEAYNCDATVLAALRAVNGIIIPSSCVLAVHKLATSSNAALQAKAKQYFDSIFGQHVDAEVKTLAQQTLLTECVFGLPQLPNTNRQALLEVVMDSK